MEHKVIGQRVAALFIETWYPTLANSEKLFADGLLDHFRRVGRFSTKQAPYAKALAEKLFLRACDEEISESIAFDFGMVPIQFRKASRMVETIGYFPLVETIKTNGLLRLNQAFERLVQSGKKFPKFFIRDFKFTRAKDTSRNPGHLYVNLRDNTYLGKITPNGEFLPNGNCTPELHATIKELSHDPIAAAKKHGHATGDCSCCGRELTDPISVHYGIGPVCARNWFGLNLRKMAKVDNIV